MNIAVVGLWHLGTVTAACVASAGFQVIGVDESAETIAGFELVVFRFLTGLVGAYTSGKRKGCLSFAADFRTVTTAELVWITYDTPVGDDDHADVAFVLERIAALFPFLRQHALVMISSQLPVGSTRSLRSIIRTAQPSGSATFAYSPENLRLGKAIEAFTRPERVVVGVRSRLIRLGCDCAASFY